MKKIIFKVRHFTKGQKKASVLAIAWFIICIMLGFVGNHASYKLSKKVSYGKYLLFSTGTGIFLYLIVFFGGNLIAAKIEKDLAAERKAMSANAKTEEEITIDDLEDL